MLRTTRGFLSLRVQVNPLSKIGVVGSQNITRSLSSTFLTNKNLTLDNSERTSHFVHQPSRKFIQKPLLRCATFQNTSTLFIIRNFSVSFNVNQADESINSSTVQISEALQSASETVTTEATVTTSEVLPSSNELVLDFLPEKPTPLVLDGVDVQSTIQWVGDPPLDTLGLASWWPSGRVQALLEYLHGTVELPWWATIMLVTLSLRILTFPLVVKMQRNVAIMNNNNPKLVAIQSKISDARRRGDPHDVAMHTMEMQEIFKGNNVSPFSNLVPMMIQLPIFMSMFFGLKGMANLPLESMMTGGLFWFQDLTIPDPYYGLSFLMSATVYLQFKLAADGASLENAGPIAKKLMLLFPLVLFPLSMNFPAAVPFYWVTTNCISIAQAGLVRQDRVREALKIPKRIIWDKKDMPNSKKGFREGIRDIMDNTKVQSDIFDRKLYDAESFKRAGAGKVKRTFKFDPTKSKA